MPMKTRIIGTRIPVVLYEQLEKCAGDSRALGEVFKEVLERYCFPSGSKPVANRSNTNNLGIITDKVHLKSSFTDLIKNKQLKERSDNFEV